MKYITNAFGTVKILVEGFFIEKFINICTHRNIKLNNMKRLNGCILETQVSVNDFKSLRDVCKKTKCRLKILDKKGLAFLFHRYRKRKIAIISIILIIILFIYASTLIWKIDINCEQPEILSQVNTQLEQMGIRKYVSKYKWDEEYIKSEIMLNIQEITWIEMQFNGVVLTIDIKTGTVPPEIIDTTQPCNIVATKAGIIEQVIVKNGLKTVDVGTIVEKGDLLITGAITSEVIDDYYINADGEVLAKVWYFKTIQVPLKENKYEYTGNKETFYGTNLINKKVFLGKVSTNYEEYDTMLKENNLKVFNIFLPIKIYEYTYYEKQTQNIDRTYEEALQYGLSIVEPMMLEQIPKQSQIVNKINNDVLVDNDLKIELIYECIEQIGTKEKIY